MFRGTDPGMATPSGEDTPMRSKTARLGVESLEVRAVPTAGLDWTFGRGGRVIVPSPDDIGSVLQATVDAQNRILVLEAFADGVGVLRLLPNGYPDVSFGDRGTARLRFDRTNPPPQPGLNVSPGTLNSFSPADFAVDANGRIVIAGTNLGRLPPDGWETHFAALRLNPDGTFDPTFDGDGVAVLPFMTPSANNVTSLSVSPDGKIVLAGSFRDPGSTTPAPTDAAVVRLNDDGSPDTSFNATGSMTFRFTDANSEVVLNSVADVAVDGSGRIIVIDNRFTTARFTPDGQLDATFGLGGWVELTFDIGFVQTSYYSPPWSSKVVVGPGGTITIGGGITWGSIWTETYAYDDVVFRLTPDGNYDSSFNWNGQWSTYSESDRFLDIAVDAADHLVVSNGTFANFLFYPANIYRLNPNGSGDESFGPYGQFTLPAGGFFSPAPRQLGDEFSPAAAALQVDGKILFAGAVDTRAGRALEVVRIDPNAPLHPTPRAVPVAVSAEGAAVQIYRTTDTNDLVRVQDVTPFPGFTGPVRAATADFNNDQVDDFVYASGHGAAVLRIVDGASGKDMLSDAVFAPYEPSFTGGLYVTVGDFDGDGVPELVVSPDAGGGARVQIFSLVNGSLVQKDNFFAIDDPNFRGGCRVAVGDFNGDGVPDLAVGAGTGGGPRVALYDGHDLLQHHDSPVKLTADFFAFPDANNLHDGVFVAAGDVDGDGVAELAVAPGDGGGPRVRLLHTDGSPLADFFADDETLRGGARVAVKDTDGDGLAELIVGSGAGVPSKVQVYLRTGLPASAGPDQTFDPFVLAPPGGVYVG
jgi:uncharacterized delta-60 repeat protein